jgi:DNA-binding transcriptional regulator YiaG
MPNPRPGRAYPISESHTSIILQLIAYRQENQIEQWRIARRLKIGINTLQTWEQGLRIPSNRNLFRWVDCLGLELYLTKKKESDTI